MKFVSAALALIGFLAFAYSRMHWNSASRRFVVLPVRTVVMGLLLVGSIVVGLASGRLGHLALGFFLILVGYLVFSWALTESRKGPLDIRLMFIKPGAAFAWVSGGLALMLSGVVSLAMTHILYAVGAVATYGVVWLLDRYL